MFNPLLTSSIRQLSTHGFRRALRLSLRAFTTSSTATIRIPTVSKPALGLLFAASGTLVAAKYGGGFSSRILNDAVLSPVQQQVSSGVQTAKAEANRAQYKTRFGGSLNYNELCIGSVTGLFLGIVAGKLSHVIVVLTLLGYFLIQFLESRGIITFPWRKIVLIGSEKVDLKTLVLEQPSFKILFVLTFITAALNV